MTTDRYAIKDGKAVQLKYIPAIDFEKLDRQIMGIPIVFNPKKGYWPSPENGIKIAKVVYP